MPGNGRQLANLRIDTRGHTKEVQVQWFVDPDWYWAWYDLDGEITSSGTALGFIQKIHELRIDTRGHIVAVGKYDEGDPRWYNLKGSDIGAGGDAAWEGNWVIDLRIDSRGHIIAVGMDGVNAGWYDLDGNPL